MKIGSGVSKLKFFFYCNINLKNISASLDKNYVNYYLIRKFIYFFRLLKIFFFIHIFLSIRMKKYCDDKYEMYIRKIITQNAKRNPFTNANFTFSKWNSGNDLRFVQLIIWRKILILSPNVLQESLTIQFTVNNTFWVVYEPN